jgi:hypothetical protein
VANGAPASTFHRQFPGRAVFRSFFNRMRHGGNLFLIFSHRARSLYNVMPD